MFQAVWTTNITVPFRSIKVERQRRKTHLNHRHQSRTVRQRLRNAHAVAYGSVGDDDAGKADVCEVMFEGMECNDEKNTLYNSHDNDDPMQL